MDRAPPKKIQQKTQQKSDPEIYLYFLHLQDQIML